MTGKLDVAVDLALSLDLVIDSFAVIGRRGSGKSHTSSVLAEGMLEAGCQIVVIDPTNAWYGLKSSADGSVPAFPVTVFGRGKYSDVELAPDYGALLADFVVDRGRSVILSTRHFTRDQQCRFVAEFAERLYLRKEGDPSPLHLFCDECDGYAPQTLGQSKFDQQSLAALDALLRRGRTSGIGMSLITQRPAVMSKNMLFQAAILVCHQLNGPSDQKLVEAWFKAHEAEDSENFDREQLSKLKTGQAWFAMSGDGGFLKRAQVRARKTYDSSQTPKVGVKRVAPRALAQVDLQELSAQLSAAVSARAEQDPERIRETVLRLRDQVTQLDKELETLRGGAVTEFQKQQLRRLGDEAQRLRRDTQELQALSGRVVGALGRVVAICADALGLQRQDAPVDKPVPPELPPARSEGGARDVAGPAAETKPADGAAAALLRVLVQLGPLSLEQAALAAGYAQRSGHFASAMRTLRERALIAGEASLLSATAQGSAYEREHGEGKPVPRGAALREFWRGKLSELQNAILDLLAKRYPNRCTVEHAAERLGYAQRSGHFAEAVRALRARALIEGPAKSFAISERLIG